MRFSLKRLLLTFTLVTIGLGLCGAEYGTMFWGNWLHSATFSIGVLIVLVAISVFVGSLSSLDVGVIVFGVLLFFYTFLFWMFPGWALLHHVISQFVE